MMKRNASYHLSDATVAEIAGGGLRRQGNVEGLGHLASCPRCQNTLEAAANSNAGSIDVFICSELVVARILHRTCRPTFHVPLPYWENERAILTNTMPRSFATGLSAIFLTLSPAVLAASTLMTALTIGFLGLLVLVSSDKPTQRLETFGREHVTRMMTTSVRVTNAPAHFDPAEGLYAGNRTPSEAAPFQANTQQVEVILFAGPGMAMDSIEMSRLVARLKAHAQSQVRLVGESVVGLGSSQKAANGRQLAQLVRSRLAYLGVDSSRVAISGAVWAKRYCKPTDAPCLGANARVIAYLIQSTSKD